MYFFLTGGITFFCGVIALGRIEESLGARDQVDVEFMEMRERFIEKRLLETFSNMEGGLLRLFSAVNRNGGAREGWRGGVELELERLAVRCLEANVEPHIEVLSGPDTDRDEEVVDKRLVERLCGSFDPDTDRRVAGWTG